MATIELITCEIVRPSINHVLLLETTHITSSTVGGSHSGLTNRALICYCNKDRNSKLSRLNNISHDLDVITHIHYAYADGIHSTSFSVQIFASILKLPLTSGHLAPRLTHGAVDVDVESVPGLAQELVADNDVADYEAAVELHALERVLEVVLRLAFTGRRRLVEDLVARTLADAHEVLLAVAHEELAARGQTLVDTRLLVLATAVVCRHSYHNTSYTNTTSSIIKKCLGLYE